MPDPREAVYDVLLAKKRRADEIRKAEEKAAENGGGLAEYNRGVLRAREAYNPSGRRW